MAQQCQVTVSLCSIRVLHGNGKGGDRDVDCTAAHCSTARTKACEKTRLAAVCQPQFRGKALRLYLHYEYFLTELPAIFPEALQLTE